MDSAHTVTAHELPLPVPPRGSACSACEVAAPEPAAAACELAEPAAAAGGLREGFS
jgi:hypothetical protein